MSVAHWQALQVCGESIPLAQQCVHDDSLLGSLAAMLAAGPLSLTLDTGVRQLFMKAWHLTAQASRVVVAGSRCGLSSVHAVLARHQSAAVRGRERGIETLPCYVCLPMPDAARPPAVMCLQSIIQLPHHLICRIQTRAPGGCGWSCAAALLGCT